MKLHEKGNEARRLRRLLQTVSMSSSLGRTLSSLHAEGRTRLPTYHS